jgi:hypothetical protein
MSRWDGASGVDRNHYYISISDDVLGKSGVPHGTKKARNKSKTRRAKKKNAPKLVECPSHISQWQYT